MMIVVYVLGTVLSLIGALGVAGVMIARRGKIAYPPAASLIRQPEEDVWLTREDETLLLHWRGTAPDWVEGNSDGRYEIAGNPSALPIPEDNSLHPIIRVHSNAFEGQQRFISVGERFIDIDGAENFRDLGGYPTSDGKRLRWGQVYRSGRLSQLTPKGMEQLRSLGISLVCDLRSELEIHEDPDRLPDELRYRNVPLTDKTPTRKRLYALLFNRRHLESMMLELYTQLFIEQNARTYGEVLRRLAEADALPAVIHCTAGKDRAGTASALLLLALGVPEDIVIADYTLSNHFHAHFHHITGKLVRRLNFLNIDADDLYPLLTANARTMQTTIAHIKKRYGSVENYLREQAGLDEATLGRLRALLLED